MSQSINHHRNKSELDHAGTSIAEREISRIEQQLTGARRLDPWQATEDLAQLVAPIRHCEHERAEAERKQRRAKRHACDQLERAARAFLKAIASGDS